MRTQTTDINIHMFGVLLFIPIGMCYRSYTDIRSVLKGVIRRRYCLRRYL